MEKRRFVIAGIMMELIAAGVCAVSYLPRPVLRNPEAVVDTYIIIYTDGDGEELRDFDERAVLEFLTTLQKQPVSRNVSKLWTPTVCIGFHGSEHDNVFLRESDMDCVCGVYGERYRILEPDRAFAEICEILGINAA